MGVDKREKVIANVIAIVSDMQEEVDEWKDYSDSELRGGLTCDCDWWYKTLQTLKDAIALLKAKEHPTDECIRNAIFCLQNPHDCLETEVEEARKMSLYALKAREPKMVTGVAEMYKDILVGNCPSCDQTIVSNVKKPTKYCRFCGQAVKFE